MGTLYNFQVSNNETMIERDRAESFQAVASLFDKLDTNFSDFHNLPPAARGPDAIFPT